MSKKRQNARREVLENDRRGLSARVLWWGCSWQIDATSQVLYTADAYRFEGKRFTVIADDKPTAFFELERIIPISQMPNDSAKPNGYQSRRSRSSRAGAHSLPNRFSSARS
jgi:hypothetical protein